MKGIEGLVDAHCHLADPRFDGDRGEVLARAREAGITTFFQGGVGPVEWQRQLSLAKREQGWLTSFGLHPWFVAQNDEQVCQEAFEQLKMVLHQAFALGECGLDYHPRFAKDSRARQLRFLQAQLQLAQSCGKPLVLHVVRAHQPVQEQLDRFGPFKGIVHAFTGSYEIAKRYLDQGLILSIGGAVTQKGHHKLKDAVSRLPKEGFIIESDAPDQAPTGFAGHQGRDGRIRNEPLAILQVARTLADLRNTGEDEILKLTRDNFKAYFGLGAG